MLDFIVSAELDWRLMSPSSSVAVGWSSGMRLTASATPPNLVNLMANKVQRTEGHQLVSEGDVTKKNKTPARGMFTDRWITGSR